MGKLTPEDLRVRELTLPHTDDGIEWPSQKRAGELTPVVWIRMRRWADPSAQLPRRPRIKALNWPTPIDFGWVLLNHRGSLSLEIL